MSVELSYLALGTSALGLIAATLALVLSLRAERHIAHLSTTLQGKPKPNPEPAGTLDANIRSLELRVSSLENQLQRERPRTAQPAYSPPPAGPQSVEDEPLFSLVGELRPGSPGFSGSTQTPVTSERRTAGSEDQWLSNLLSDYEKVSEDRSGAVDAFMAKYLPKAASGVSGTDRFTLGDEPETAMLWVIGAADDRYVMLPGLRALTNWSGHFAPSRTSAAQEYFGSAFNLEANTPRFAMQQPAILKTGEDGNILILVERGRLQGFLS